MHDIPGRTCRDRKGNDRSENQYASSENTNIIGTHKQFVEDLVYPRLLYVVEAEAIGPDADHSPAVELDDGEGDSVEHGHSGELMAFLDIPGGEYAGRLVCLALPDFHRPASR